MQARSVEDAEWQSPMLNIGWVIHLAAFAVGSYVARQA